MSKTIREYRLARFDPFLLSFYYFFRQNFNFFYEINILRSIFIFLFYVFPQIFPQKFYFKLIIFKIFIFFKNKFKSKIIKFYKLSTNFQVWTKNKKSLKTQSVLRLFILIILNLKNSKRILICLFCNFFFSHIKHFSYFLCYIFNLN